MANGKITARIVEAQDFVITSEESILVKNAKEQESVNIILIVKSVFYAKVLPFVGMENRGRIVFFAEERLFVTTIDANLIAKIVMEKVFVIMAKLETTVLLVAKAIFVVIIDDPMNVMSVQLMRQYKQYNISK